MDKISEITITDFVNTEFRKYWNYMNSNGKNGIVGKEQLPEVVRKIIYSAYKLNIRENSELKTVVLSGELTKIHPHGTSSNEDSVKALATAYKSEPAIRLLHGIGNFGVAPGDPGAAARYTSVGGTPLLSTIYNDIPFMPTDTEDTGEVNASYISTPLPIAIIGGLDTIGAGEATYIPEHRAVDVIDWIDRLQKNGWSKRTKPPKISAISNCEITESNGRIYYQTKIKRRVDPDHPEKKGRYDIITELPPSVAADIVISKIKNRFKKVKTLSVENRIGENNPVFISIYPSGLITESDMYTLNLKLSKKQNILVWEDQYKTIVHSDLQTIAKEWFDDRCQVVTKRLSKEVEDISKDIHKIDLIRIYAENEMNKWKYDEIVGFYKNLDSVNGEADANLILNQPAKAFLKENLGKNEIIKEKDNDKIKKLTSKISNIGDVVIEEAYDIIKKQEEFFKSL